MSVLHNSQWYWYRSNANLLKIGDVWTIVVKFSEELTTSGGSIRLAGLGTTKCYL